MKFKNHITIFLLLISLFSSNVNLYSNEHLNYLSLGSSKEEVIGVLGTPDEINAYLNSWYYGSNRISFDHNNKIKEYTNAKALKISLTQSKEVGFQETSSNNIRLKATPTISFDHTKNSSLSKTETSSGYGEISSTTGRAKTVHVKGYTRKDGTYVKPHYRSPPKKK